MKEHSISYSLVSAIRFHDIFLMHHQILRAIIQRNVWQSVRRIKDLIFYLRPSNTSNIFMHVSTSVALQVEKR